LTLATVDLQPDREVAETALRRGVITKAGAPLLDSLGEHVTDRSGKNGEARERRPVAGAGRSDAGAKKRFGGIDVADAGDQALVHQQGLHGRSAGVQGGWQQRLDVHIQRLHPEGS